MKKIYIIAGIAITAILVVLVLLDFTSTASLKAKDDSLIAAKQDFNKLVTASLPENIKDTYSNYQTLTQNKDGELANLKQKVNAINELITFSLFLKNRELRRDIKMLKIDLTNDINEYQDIVNYTKSVSVSLDLYYAFRTDYTKKDVINWNDNTITIENRYEGYAGINMFSMPNTFFKSKSPSTVFADTITDLKSQTVTKKASELQQFYVSNLEQEKIVADKLVDILVKYGESDADIQRKYSETIGSKFRITGCFTKCLNYKAANKKKYEGSYVALIKELKTVLSKNNEELNMLYANWRQDWQ